MVEVKFHDIGEGMTEGEVVHYLVGVGDTVVVDQPLVELQTDKMVAELPSPAAGTIKAIHIDPGKVVEVGTVILEIDDGSSGKEAAATVATTEATESESGSLSSKSEAIQDAPEKTNQEIMAKDLSATKPHRILAAPYTRKTARENGVDIEQISGTGPAGRITEEDVYRFIAGAGDTQEQEQVPVRAEFSNGEEPDTIPFIGMRKQIAKKMTESLTTIPHVTHFDEVDLTNVLAFRKTLKEDGESISVVAFFLKALAITLKDFPIFNGQLDEENDVIRLYKNYHIGLATDTAKGLVVPVLPDVDKKTIRGINAEMKGLTKKAQNGELTASEMKNGTFTMSNVGPLGGTGATPIINHPQTGIIAFHKTKKTPVVIKDDEIAIRSIMTMSLSFDHRVADGAMAVAFTNRFIALMEDPKKLLLEMV